MRYQTPKRLSLHSADFLQPTWRQYVVAFATFVAVSLLNLSLHDWIGHQAIALVYLLSIVLISLFVSRGAIIFSTVLSAVGWGFLHAPPRFSFQIAGFYDKMMLATYFVVALTVGHLTTRLRAQRAAEMEREERTAALYLLTKELAATTNLDDVFCAVIRLINSYFGVDVAVLLPSGQPAGQLLPYTASTWSPGKAEQPVAALALTHNLSAGRGTKTSPEAEGLYLPLIAGDVPAGVLALRCNFAINLTPPQLSLLGDFTRQITVVWDRQTLRSTEWNNKLLSESERLSRTLLNSISHELRTPIAVINTAASGLLAVEALSTAQKNLAKEIEMASERLNRLVQSLLSAARLQSGQIRPQLEWCEVADLVQVALSRVEGFMIGRSIETQISSNLPLVEVDFNLMEQVIGNLLMNAAMHTPPNTPVAIYAHREKDELLLEVIDRGPGLPDAELERVFDLFHRAPNAKPGGTGLGLAIVKGFVEAQGGKVQAMNHPEGGAIFAIRLPAKEKPELPKETL